MALENARVNQEALPLPVQRSRTGVVIVLQALGDLIAIGLALLASFFLRRLFGPIDTAPYLRLLPAGLIFPLAFLWAGLYPGYGLGPVEELRRIGRFTSLAALILLASTFLFRTAGELSRVVILVGWLLAMVLVPLQRAAFRALFARRSWWGRPVLILGAAKTAEVLVRRLMLNPGLGLKPVACLDDDLRKHGQQCGGVPILGSLRLAPEMARNHRIPHVIVAMPGLSRHRLTEVVEEYAALFLHVTLVPDLLGLTSLWVSAHDMQGVLGLQLQQNLLSLWNRFLKRSMDLAVSLPAMLIAGPIILILGGLVKLFSPGPAFYTQEREGLNGRRIRVWKLRTMVVNAEEALQKHLAENPATKQEWEQFMKLRHDPRIVPVIGKLLRRLSLDELPQLWNIVCGDMSLVGPRPFPEYHLARFSPHFRSLRCRVTPGLTGLWQVSARSEGDLGVQEELDTYYIRNWSLWLDLHLLARTVQAVLFGTGAY